MESPPLPLVLGLGAFASANADLDRGGAWCAVEAWYGIRGRGGRMEKMPRSPVSVVFLSMLSSGPGEMSNVFSFTLRRGGRKKGREGPGRCWGSELAE